MRGRNGLVLTGIAMLVVALGVYRATSTPTTTSPLAPARNVSEASLPTLLDFGRGECIPCQKMMPVLDTLAERHEGRIRVQYLDLADPGNQERAGAMRVRVIPTQILLGVDGAEVERHEGFWALEAIEQRMGELGWTTGR